MATAPSTYPILPTVKPAEGLTQRQQYAIAIMTGLLSNPVSHDQNWFAKLGVEMAFKLADAMIQYELEVEPIS